MNNSSSDAKQKQDKLKAELYERRKLALAAVSVVYNQVVLIQTEDCLNMLLLLTARANERNSLEDHRTRRCERLDYHQSHLR